MWWLTCDFSYISPHLKSRNLEEPKHENACIHNQTTTTTTALPLEINLHKAHTPLAMDLFDLKPTIRLLDQFPELLLRPLFRIDHNQHGDIQLPQQPLLIPRPRVQFREHRIIDNERGSGGRGLQRRDKLAQDGDAFLIGPIVDALADEEGRGIVHGLRVEEIVAHIGDAGAEGEIGGFGEQRLALGDHVRGFVLDDEGEGGELLGEVDGDVAGAAADVDDFAVAEALPGVAVAELGELAVHW